MNEFTFKYQNNKGALYLVLAIFGVPFGVLFLSFFLMDHYVSWIFWITIPLMIGLIVYCIRLFIKTSRNVDTITLDDRGFTSANYGRVLYSDIHSIPPYGAFQAPPPSMRIKLHNGEKLVWIFNPEDKKSQDDVATFTEFREELLEHLRQQAQPATEGLGVAESRAQHIPERTTAPPIEVINQLETHKKRDFNYKHITIPFVFVFAVFMFVRGCGEDIIREHRNKELAGVRNAVLRMETDYGENIEEAKRVAAAYSRKFGAVFLFTNDPQGKVEFIPNIEKDGFAPEIKLIGLRRAEDNKLLKKFIEHPDSVSYNLVVSNPSMAFFTVMNKSIFGEADSTAAVVYFAVYNPHESLPSKFRSTSDSTSHPIQYSTSINVPKKGNLTEDVLKNMDFASIRAILQKYDGTYFYMVVKEQDGISPERFEEIKALVEANFKEHGLTTDHFQSRHFNTE